MIPGPTLIHQCPNCQKNVKCDSLGSGNTFDAIFFSDGFMVAPMYPEYSQLVKCPYCEEIFWFYKAAEKGKYNPYKRERFKRFSWEISPGKGIITHVETLYGSEKEFEDHINRMKELYENSKDVKVTYLSDLLVALEKKIYDSQEEEKKIRLRIWRTLNNRIRQYLFLKIFPLLYQIPTLEYVTEDFLSNYIPKSANDIFSYSEFFDKLFNRNFELFTLFNNTAEFYFWKDNLSRLLELLNYDIISERVLIAEIYRNFGRFDKSLEVITSINDSSFKQIVKDFKRECKKRNVFVFKLTEHE